MQEEHGVVSVAVTNDGKPCAEGMLTFVFLDIQNELLHVARAELYKLWLRGAKEVGK